MHRSALLHRQSGAARVSITWLISFLVLFFVMVGVAYMGFDEAALLRETSARDKAAAEAAEANFSKESEALSTLSRAVGWFDPEQAVARTNPDSLKAAFEELKASFPEIKSDVKTLADALPLVARAYNERGREIAELNNTKAALTSEKATMETSLREAVRQKDTEIADLRRQLQDATNNANQRQAELEQRIAALSNQQKTLDAEVRTAKNSSEDLRRKFDEERQTWEARTQAVTHQLRFLQEPEAKDGTVLSASRDLDIGWIDLGAKNRLARGMKFRVVSGRVGAEKVKAWAEVTRVEPDTAEVRFYDIADRFDPVVKGDVVYNPLFDPSMERQAVLAGRFTAPYDEKELRVLLAGMGITVQTKLDVNTDYLIVGSDLFTDENGEPLEDPLSPSELPIYKDAEAQGVQIVPIKSLLSYFKF